jgi:hypothetical protein
MRCRRRVAIARLSLLCGALVGGPGCASRPLLSCPPVASDSAIAVPAVSAAVPVNTRLSARASSASATIAIDDNQGTLTIAGQPPLQAFLYDRDANSALDSILFTGLAMSADAWYPFWIDCRNGRVADLSYESTNSDVVVNEFADGPCNELAAYFEAAVEIPAMTLRNVNMTCGFEVHNPDSEPPLDLRAGQPGTATFEGAPATVLTFATVDCRGGNCGSSPPLFELHSLLWQPESGQIGFTIWYLNGVSSGTGVFTKFGFLLPAATEDWDLTFPRANWTIDFGP